MPRYNGYLICSRAGNVKFRKTRATASNEVAVAFDFELPAALFEKPVLRLRTAVDPVAPIVVNPEQRVRAQEILEEQLGVRVELTIEPARAQCGFCNGTGNGGVDASGALTPCIYCGGSGRLTEDPCPRCGSDCGQDDPCDEKKAFDVSKEGLQ